MDGQLCRRDDRTYLQRFTPRRAHGPWSARTVGLVGRLEAECRLRPRGLAEIAAARADGRWDRLTKANRYALIWRTGRAKRAGTRPRRIADFVAMLERGETPHPHRR